MGDTGLLVSLAFSENELTENKLFADIMDGKLSLNEGMLYENVIAQIIAAKGKKLFFYTRYSDEKHRNDIEIDFLLSNESRTNYRITPVEVKSSKNYSTVSIGKFVEIFKRKIDRPLIVHPKNLSVVDDILRIPAYMFALCD
jgi:predicted AAA+ superfamily ATPase